MSFHLIERGSSVECDNIPEAGTRARLILINFNDVRKIYYSDIGVITGVEMKPSKQGYEFIGFRTDVKKSDEAVRRDRSNRRFAHSISFVIYEVDQEQKTNINKLVKGRVLAIVENNGKDENAIELLGKDCGLQIIGGQIRNEHEGGFFTIGLATPDNGVEFERKLPQQLGTSYTNGLELIDEILNITIPANALLNEDGTPILTEDGEYILIE